MRALRPLLFASIALAAAFQAHAVEFGIARAGSAYATIAAADADACARLCEADGLCMAWTHRAGACELKAVAPAPIVEAGANSGLSQRAPAFARNVPLPAPQKPIPEAIVTADAASPMQTAQLGPDDSALLGGLLSDDEIAIRPRLGSRP